MKYSELIEMFESLCKKGVEMGWKREGRPINVSFSMYYPGDRIHFLADTLNGFHVLELSATPEAVRKIDSQLENTEDFVRFLVETANATEEIHPVLLQKDGEE